VYKRQRHFRPAMSSIVLPPACFRLCYTGVPVMLIVMRGTNGSKTVFVNRKTMPRRQRWPGQHCNTKYGLVPVRVVLSLSTGYGLSPKPPDKRRLSLFSVVLLKPYIFGSRHPSITAWKPLDPVSISLPSRGYTAGIMSFTGWAYARTSGCRAIPKLRTGCKK